MKLLSRRWLLPLVAATALSADLHGQTAPGAARPAAIREATVAFEAGSKAFQSGDFTAARTSFATAVRLAPRVAAGHSALGAVLLELRQYPAAVRELQAALSLQAADPATLLHLAVAQSMLGQYQPAAATLATLRPLDPAFDQSLPPPFVLPLANALSRSGESPAAESLLRNALAASPDDAALLDALGAVQAQQQHFAEAEATFTHALALNPRLAAAYYHLGAVDLATQRLAEAAEQTAHAHQLEPANLAYTFQLARAWLETSREDKAVDLLRSALVTTPTGDPQRVELQYRLALALQSADRPREALPYFTAAVAARAQDSDTLINAALAHVQTGDAAGALPLYQRALKLSPANPTLREDLGVAYLQQNDLNGALAQFRAGLALDDNSPQLHYDLALALKLKDDIPAAIPEFQRAAALDPSLPDPPYTLGVIFMQQGRFADAADSFEKNLALRPDNGEAYALLGSVYRDLGQPDKAEAALRRAIQLLPAQPSPHITLAAVLSSQGQRDEAAAERKIGADLTRAAVNKQKAAFALESGRALLNRGQLPQALTQLQNAVAADPTDPATHSTLAEALERSGRKAEAAAERSTAAGLTTHR